MMLYAYGADPSELDKPGIADTLTDPDSKYTTMGPNQNAHRAAQEHDAPVIYCIPIDGDGS